MIKYSVLGSGSSGNSYLFSCDGVSILVDAGFSLKEIKSRVGLCDISFDTIQALFLTHLHPDHVLGAGVFARQTLLPVFVSEKCMRYTCNQEYARLHIPEQCSFVMKDTDFVQIGPFKVSCFYTSHDSSGSVGYCIEAEEKVFVIVTDTGVYDTYMLQTARRANVLFLESNYDEEMLIHGPYPLVLKKRIAGQRGHLSNLQAKSFLEETEFKGLAYMIHLSDNNNTPALVEDCVQNFNAIVCEKRKQYLGTIG